MISRIWHGYTTHTNADDYEALLKSEIYRDPETVRLTVTVAFNYFVECSAMRWNSSPLCGSIH